MRVSTLGAHNTTLQTINDTQQLLNDEQNKLSTGKKFQTISEDPAAGSKALNVDNSLRTITRFDSSIRKAENYLSQEESLLDQYLDRLSQIKELVIRAANSGVFTKNIRTKIGLSIQQTRDFIFNLANTKNAHGEYIFSGYKSNQPAFLRNPDGSYLFQGDQGKRVIRVGSSTTIDANDSGHAIFGNISVAKGTFETEEDINNTGVATITNGRIDNLELAKTFNETYTLTVNTAGPPLRYDVYAASDPITPVAGYNQIEFVDNKTIKINGIGFEITGMPDVGDSFILKPINRQNIFDILTHHLDVLNEETNSSILHEESKRMIENIDNAIDVGVDVQSQVGIRRLILDAQRDINAESSSANKKLLSELEDVDFVDATSRFTSYRYALEVSQKVYSQVQDLSLFNYL